MWKDTSFIVFTWLSVTVNMNPKHGKHVHIQVCIELFCISIYSWRGTTWEMANFFKNTKCFKMLNGRFRSTNNLGAPRSLRFSSSFFTYNHRTL